MKKKVLIWNLERNRGVLKWLPVSYWELLSLHDQRFSLSLSLTEQDAAQALRIDLDDAEHICKKQFI